MAKKNDDEEIKKRIEELKKLAEAEEWEALEREAERFIEDYPEHSAGYFFRSISRSEQGRHEEALEDINTAINIEPSADAYNNRGKIYLALGAFAEALADFEKASDIEPENRQFNYNRRVASANQVSKQTVDSLTSAIGRFVDSTKAELKTVTEGQLEEITNPQKIIEQFDKDINQSHLKLYGFPEGGNDECTSILCRIKTYFAKIIGHYPKTHPKPL